MIKRQEVAECCRKMAADFHKEPWFRVSGSRKQVHTCVGTLPGDPLADVVFALTFLAFQNSLEQSSSSGKWRRLLMYLGDAGASLGRERWCRRFCRAPPTWTT